MNIFIILIILVVLPTLNQNPTFLSNPIPIGGGLHDHIAKFNRPKLEAVALALEKYHRKDLPEKKIGGMHDYIWRIHDEELRSYIIREAKEHPEVDDITIIDEMAKEFSKKEDEIILHSGIHDLLSVLDRDPLNKLAFKMERYHRKQTGTEKYMGGLHDYITYMPNEEIKNYIIREIKCHPELNSVEALRAFVDENKIPEQSLFLDISKVSSLEKAISDANREKLEIILVKLNQQLNGKYKYLTSNLHPFSNGDLRKFIHKIIEDDRENISIDELINI
jgi:hypothetical protein